MTKEEAKDKLLKQNKWPMVADLFCGKNYLCVINSWYGLTRENWKC